MYNLIDSLPYLVIGLIKKYAVISLLVVACLQHGVLSFL